MAYLETWKNMRILAVSGYQANFMTSATYLILITASKVDA
jgi:hypothetical protein